MDLVYTLALFLIILGGLFFFIYERYHKLESRIIAISAFLSLAIVLCFIIIISKVFKIYTGSGYIDMESTGQVGDFIGGVVGTIVGGISVVLLYRTLQTQNESFIKNQIESRFFELLKFHRDNVNEIEFLFHKSKEACTIVKSRHFFVTANRQLEYAFEEFQNFYKSNKIGLNDIYEEKYLSELKAKDIYVNRGFSNFYLLAKIDICYLILFIGVSRNGGEEILEVTKNKYKATFMADLIYYFRMKPSIASVYYPKWKGLYENNLLINNMEVIRQKRRDYDNKGSKYQIQHSGYYPDNFNKYYGGHQFRLGHYFRHLYQIVSFVDQNKNLLQSEKRNYIRILRGQLSDYEQKLFFYNSLSQLGRVWEYSDKIKSESHLITEYNIIKSITNTTLVDNLRPKDLYPLNE